MNPSQSNSIQEEVIRAFLKVIAREGFAGASLETIAKEAGVDPIELGRRFPSISELAHQVTEKLLNRLDATVPEPGGDLETQLKSFASDYWEFWQQYPGILAYYWEAGKNSQLRNMVLEQQNRTRAKIVDFFAFYRKNGSFIQELDELDDEELEHELVGAFLGSIFARVTWQTLGIVKARFNTDRHVRCFLKGYGRPRK
ncbi:TetR/AcrR family transcriptional regulator [Acidobacteriota bacterium]